MPKSFLRIITILLVPYLIADPATAHAFAAGGDRAIFPPYETHPSVFAREAMAARALDMVQIILLGRQRITTSRLARGFIAAGDWLVDIAIAGALGPALGMGPGLAGVHRSHQKSSPPENKAKPGRKPIPLPIRALKWLDAHAGQVVSERASALAKQLGNIGLWRFQNALRERGITVDITPGKPPSKGVVSATAFVQRYADADEVIPYTQEQGGALFGISEQKFGVIVNRLKAKTRGSAGVPRSSQGIKAQELLKGTEAGSKIDKSTRELSIETGLSRRQMARYVKQRKVKVQRPLRSWTGKEEVKEAEKSLKVISLRPNEKIAWAQLRKAYEKNEIVRHETYGNGKIVRFVDSKVTIKFEKNGEVAFVVPLVAKASVLQILVPERPSAPNSTSEVPAMYPSDVIENTLIEKLTAIDEAWHPDHGIVNQGAVQQRIREFEETIKGEIVGEQWPVFFKPLAAFYWPMVLRAMQRGWLTFIDGVEDSTSKVQLLVERMDQKDEFSRLKGIFDEAHRFVLNVNHVNAVLKGARFDPDKLWMPISEVPGAAESLAAAFFDVLKAGIHGGAQEALGYFYKGDMAMVEYAFLKGFSEHAQQKHGEIDVGILSANATLSQRLAVPAIPGADPLTLDALTSLVDRLEHGHEPGDQIRAMRTIETIFQRVHAPEALVFDFGGVVVYGSHRLGIQNFVTNDLGLDLKESELDQLHHRIFEGEPIPGQNYPAARIGQATEDQYLANALPVFEEVLDDRFIKAFTSRHGLLTAESFITVFRPAYYAAFNRMEENENTLLQLMMTGIPVFILSNNYRQKYDSIRNDRVPFLHHIGAYLSDQAGVSKPDPGIFRGFIQDLEAKRGRRIDASRILFFDDKIQNCRAAYVHGGFYASQYDSNRSEKLSENQVIHEILTKTALLNVISRLERIASGNQDTDAAVVAAATETLERLRPLARGMDVRTRLTALRDRLNEQERRLLDKLGFERTVELSRTYAHELENLYEAEKRLRGVEFEMVYARAGLGLPMRSPGESEADFRARQQRAADRISTQIQSGGLDTTVYDKARRDIDNIIDPWSPPNLYEITMELSRIGVDAYFAMPYHQALVRWQGARQALQQVLANEPGMDLNLDDLTELLVRVSAVLEQRQALKDFRKPLIAIVAGGNGVGKSTLASPIAWFLHLKPKSSDDTRAPLRELIPKDLSPEIHGSSFERPLNLAYLPHYFEHAAIILGGLSGKGGIFAEWQRQIDSGESGLWEGVIFIPGFIPPYFYEIANIVQMVVDVAGNTVEERKQTHIERFTQGRAKDTGAAVRKADRYVSRIGQIRAVQELFLSLAKIYGLTIIQNDNPKAAVARALASIITPFADNPPVIPSAFAEQGRRVVQLRQRIKNDARFGRAVHFARDKQGNAFIQVKLSELNAPLENEVKEELISIARDLDEPIVWEAPLNPWLNTLPGAVLGALAAFYYSGSHVGILQMIAGTVMGALTSHYINEAGHKWEASLAGRYTRISWFFGIPYRTKVDGGVTRRIASAGPLLGIVVGLIALNLGQGLNIPIFLVTGFVVAVINTLALLLPLPKTDAAIIWHNQILLAKAA